MGLERLDRGQGEERQEGELDALAGLEVRLGPVAQTGHPGDVDLDDRGQLGGDLQRLDHACGDDLAQAGHLLGGAALGRDRRGSARERRRRQPVRTQPGAAGRLGGLGGVQDVLLADAAADAGALDRAEVDAVLGGELAHERRDVGRGVGRTRVTGRGRRARRRGAGAAGAAAGARPAACRGQRLLRGLLVLGRLLLEGGAGLGRAAEAWAEGCGRGRRGGLLGLRRALLPAAGPTARRRAGATDDGEVGADRDGLVLADEDLAAACRRPATGSRCRPCRWRPRAAARRPRPRRPRP